MHKKRIFIFAAGAIALACAGAWIANGIDADNVALQVSGILLMSMSPLLMTVMLKTVHRERWQDIGLRFAFSANIGWYLLSFCIPVFLILYVFGLSFLSSSTSISGSFLSDLPQMVLRSGGLFLGFLVASIGEEFGWRGYLQSALLRIIKFELCVHLIVGIVWYLWHLPLVILASEFETSVFELTMILVSTLGMAVVFGTLRKLSDTVWTCVLLHASLNALLIGFGSAKPLDGGSKYQISLSSFSIAVVSFWVIAGIGIFAFDQIRRASKEASHADSRDS